jgi:ABC-type polysaccharide/polyol phosphate transport system ATPase subunit
MEAIRFEDVFLRYRVPTERIRSFKEYVIRKLKRSIRYQDREALKGVTLSIGAGETVGIIGPNGAGKSTLLQLIARVIDPSAGRVVVHGSTAPLLELGLGLQGELTGRENIVLQGALLGYSRRRMRERQAEIIEWSELGAFIDAPLRTYSTGMAARLAFAVATDVHPDILLVDEALAVGDERFQAKCKERIDVIRRDGKTVLLVSHSLVQVRENCRRAIWLHEGLVVADGEPGSVTDAYHGWSIEGGSPPESVGWPRPAPAAADPGP